MKCTNCSTENPPTSKFCEKCGNPLFAPPASNPTVPPPTTETPSDEDLAKIIRKAVHGFVSDHYRLIYISDKNAQLIRPKKTDMWVTCLFLILIPMIGVIIALADPRNFMLGIGVAAIGNLLFVLQVANYLAKRDEAVYLYITSANELGVLSDLQ